jgi:hypothetical protein
VGQNGRKSLKWALLAVSFLIGPTLLVLLVGGPGEIAHLLRPGVGIPFASLIPVALGVVQLRWTSRTEVRGAKTEQRTRTAVSWAAAALAFMTAGVACLWAALLIALASSIT